jgi:ribosomal protein S18 acetylase RimI-like enzyme
MDTTLTLREARVDELAVCARFWTKMFAESEISMADWQPDWHDRFIEYFTARISAGDTKWFVCEADGAIVGTAGAMIRDGYPVVVTGSRRGYIFGVRVEPTHRKRGMGRALTQRCVDYLCELKCTQIRLHASRFGRPVYEAMDFVPTNEMELPITKG